MRWDRPAAGREPAAAALLGWLADPHAPGLCLVTGASGCGKSALLAWLVHHGTMDGNPVERAVHAVVPFAGQSLHGTVWSLADQLGVVARSADELIEALGNDARRTVIVLPDLHSGSVVDLVLDLARLPHLRLIVESRTASPAHQVLSRVECAELDLNHDQWRDQKRYEQWLATTPEPVLAAASRAADEWVDLSDPLAVCEADPRLVTLGYERDDRDHGGLRSAWLQAGQALCQEQSPASRALIVSAVLGDSADPRIAPALADLASEAPWRREWSRVRGDVTPPWPGPGHVLAAGAGPLAGSLLVAGQQDAVRAVSVSDATPQGRLSTQAGRPRALSVMQDGTVLLLDQGGHLHADTTWAARPAMSGIERLLDQGPTDVERLLAALKRCTATALATVPGPVAGSVVLGDAAGRVTVYGHMTADAVLHKGTVTAVAGLGLPREGGEAVPVVYSGGADGTVRAWAPGHSPMPEPLVKRACPVVSLGATVTANGPFVAVAWANGAVDWIHGDTGEQRTFRPGPPVRSVALTADGRVLIGMDEALTCVTPQEIAP